MTLRSLSDLRSEFPALAQTVNGKPLSYLDSAATTQRPHKVIEAVRAFYEHDNANVHRGVHTLSMRATEKFESARRTIAKFVNASQDLEIVFTKGCTEAVNLVASTWGRSHVTEGDTVLVSEMEHHSNLVPWQQLCKQSNAKVVPIPVVGDGVLDLQALEGLLLKHRPKLVCVKHVCNAIGTVNPIAEIALMAHRAGALVMVDGAQALAHVQVDVQDLDVDFYAMAGHKVYGPMGIGALYARRALLEAMPPYQFGGGMIHTVSFNGTTYAPLPDKFEAGTPNVAGAIGFAAALEWVSDIGVKNLSSHEGELTTLCAGRLADMPGVRLIGQAPGKASIVSFVMGQAHPHDIGTILDSEGVAVRSGHHCCQPLMAFFGVPATTRASFAAYSNHEDIESLAKGLAKVESVFGSP